MTNMETAMADLREADAALAAHQPRDDLENRVKIAEQAVLAAARAPTAAEGMLEELEAEDEAAATFSEDSPEAETVEEAVTAADSIAEEEEDIFDDISPVRESNVAPVDSAAMTDVVETLATAAETIDATDEVSIEEAIEADDKPNGHDHQDGGHDQLQA